MTVFAAASGSSFMVFIFQDCGAAASQPADAFGWDGQSSGSALWIRADLSSETEIALRVKEPLLHLAQVFQSLKTPMSVDNWMAVPSILSELRKRHDVPAVVSRGSALAIIKFWLVNMDKACPKAISQQEVAQYFLHPATATTLRVQSRLEVLFNITAYNKDRSSKRHPEDDFPWLELGSRSHTGMDIAFKSGWVSAPSFIHLRAPFPFPLKRVNIFTNDKPSVFPPTDKGSVPECADFGDALLEKKKRKNSALLVYLRTGPSCSGRLDRSVHRSSPEPGAGTTKSSRSQL